MGITGTYWMKFVGKPGGKFMKHAPGNYIHGEKYKQPYGHSKFPYWELLEEVPEFVAPEPSEADSVFEESVFLPEEDEAPTVTESAPLEEITVTPTDSDGYNFDPTAPAILEPYIMFNPGTGETSDVDPTKYLTPELEPEVDGSAAFKLEIERLKAALETAKATPSVKLEEVLAEPTRKELLKTLADAEVEVKKGTRTTTLRKMVDGLGS